ncbi:MAG: hypothetical protein GW949_01380 [Spirochaetales bacterium]|nr:hypothetical protein [Spirochaetales bacterium]
MAKVSAEAKDIYSERIRGYKQEIDQVLSREKSILQVIQKNDEGKEYKLLTLAEERINMASYYLLMNQISLSLLGVKNEAFINDARKSCYESIIHLENLVSNRIDVPFSDYEEVHTKLEGFDDRQRFALVKKIGFAIHSVEDDFGDNSKWKWSFVELEGRYATIAKNLMNLKTLVAGLDPRVDGYRERYLYLELVKKWLHSAADRYREKYELSTNRIDDFKTGIAFLNALRRLLMIVGENEPAETVKKKAEVWKAKMDDDEKRMSAAAKKS